jgi:hypothetical protein
MVGKNLPRIISDDARITSLNATNATLSGDLIKRNGVYKSGTATGYSAITQTAAQWDYELQDDGIHILYGDQGSMFGHLPSTPIPGKEVTFVLSNSGATAATIGSGNISGNFYKSVAGTTVTTSYGLYLMYPNSYVSIINDGTYYYVKGTGWNAGDFSTNTGISGARWLE